MIAVFVFVICLLLMHAWVSIYRPNIKNVMFILRSFLRDSTGLVSRNKAKEEVCYTIKHLPARSQEVRTERSA